MCLNHTTGPWISKTNPYEADRSTIYATDSSHSWLISILHNGELMPIEQEANARIMAAAPELLEVAQAVIDKADKCTKPELLAAARKAVDACYD